jgi:hypothetical protein
MSKVAEKDEGARQPVEAGPPHGITLFSHAEISALIAEGDRPMQDILKERDLTESQWVESTNHWMTRMGDDVLQNGQHARIAHVYSDAFSKAQDAIKPSPPMEPEAYAKLVVDIQQAGGPHDPLAERGLSTADYLRLSRRWAAVLSSDPAQNARFFQTYTALQPPPAEPDAT